MSHRKTDVAIIGAGTAGITAFHAFAKAGRDVVLIDSGPLGTTCARVGCMPSKAVLHAGRTWATLRQALPPSMALDPAGAQALWRHAIATRDALASGTAARTRQAAGERLLLGRARFVAPGVLAVGEQRVEARAVIVATGSSPIVPAALQGLGDRLLTTDTLFELPSPPRSLGIVGLGAIGLELGLALSRLGVDVVAADTRDTVANIADPDVARRAVEVFGRELPLWLGSPVQAAADGGGVRLWRADGKTATVERLLVATGRRPNTDDLSLANAGIDLDDRGQPLVDVATTRARGTAPVFFAGDVQPDRPLMHEAVDEGGMAARQAAAWLDGERPGKPAARRVPLAILFGDPDVCTIGMPYGELDAATTIVGVAEGTGNGRSRILGAEQNLVRIYADRHDGRIRGASLIAVQGEHLAHLLAWAIQHGQTAAQMLALPYYHPSVEEMLQSAFKHLRGQVA